MNYEILHRPVSVLFHNFEHRRSEGLKTASLYLFFKKYLIHANRMISYLKKLHLEKETLLYRIVKHASHRCLAGRMAMHACPIDPTDTAPPCPGSPHWACVKTKGERFGAGNLSAPVSPLLLKCADGTTTLSLRFGIDQDLRPR